MNRFGGMFKRCPKSGRIVGFNLASGWKRWLLPVTGLLALVWFLVRVIPKPSRITYPCQQVGGSLAAVLLASLAGGFGGIVLIRKTLGLVRRHGLVFGAVFGSAALLTGTAVLLGDAHSSEKVVAGGGAGSPSAAVVPAVVSAAYADRAVARVYDPSVSSFSFGSSPYDYYWHSFNVDVLQSMLERAIREITGAQNTAAAWRLILPGVSPASKVAVKVNNNNIHFYPKDWFRSNMTDPPMVIALTRSLAAAGVAQASITFFDASRVYPDAMQEEIRKACPGVVLAGRGMATSGTKLTFSDFAYTVDIPQAVMDADYLIDCCLFKSHSGRITGAMKNLSGLFDKPGMFLHKKGKTYESSQVLCEILLHEAIQKRLKLSICEAVFGCQKPTEYLSESTLSKIAFFPDKKCSSLFVSRNPYLLDAVLLSFMNVEKTGSPNDNRGGTVEWLRNAAGKHANWPKEAVNAGTIVAGGTGMPPKDLAFNPDIVRFISVPNGGATPSKQPYSN